MSTASKIILVSLVIVILGGGGMMYIKTRAQNPLLAASENIATLKQPVIHHVALTEKGANPTDLLIKVGEYVEFDSKDGRVHDIASGAGDGDGEHHDHTANGVESGDFKPDEGYRVQFKEIGSYYFHDHLNPTLTISIGVYQPNASTTVK